MEGNGYKWTGFLDLLQSGNSDGKETGVAWRPLHFMVLGT
jgi:hypothetical protein